jgi:hypothetical protein
MIKKIAKLLLLGAVIFGFSGCEEEGEASRDPGVHFQGRDCLACHANDLAAQKGLTMAGTLYTRHDATGVQEMATLCGGGLFLRLVEVGSGAAFETNATAALHAKSPGIRGKGNLFALSEALPVLAEGNYSVQIWSENGYLLAASQEVHPISGAAYTLDAPQENANRLSCNACHRIGGSALPLYVQQNSTQCQ